MQNPIINTRKPRGARGEALVARQRMQRLGARPKGVPISEYHVGQTGTVDFKSFRGAGSTRQPTRAAGFMGGLPSFSFGE